MISLMNQELVLMTTSEVAAWFRVDTSTVRRWIESGRLHPTAITPGGHYRFSRADIERAAKADVA